MNIECAVSECRWLSFLVYKDCNSLLTETAKVEAISSLAVCCVCMFFCVRSRELKVRERRGKHLLTCQSEHDREPKTEKDVADRQRGHDELITLEKWRQMECNEDVKKKGEKRDRNQYRQ